MRFWKQSVSECGKNLWSITNINDCSSLIYDNTGFNVFDLKRCGEGNKED